MSNAAAPATEGPDRTDPPVHVAIIMDGNGRWAAARGLPRAEGHRRGVEALRGVVRAASELGILYLTIFSFSSENWSRPATEGQVLRLRIPELNEERRKELVKVAHKYAEAAKVAVRHVRRDGLDTVKKLEKNHEISEDDQERLANDVQKATDGTISEIDQLLAVKEKEILTV